MNQAASTSCSTRGSGADPIFCDRQSLPSTAETVHWPSKCFSMPGFARLKCIVPADLSCRQLATLRHMKNVGAFEPPLLAPYLESGGHNVLLVCILMARLN